MQVRLLRVLQEHKVRPVGSEDSKEINSNARVVVATNRDLRREVAERRFRQDLYYRVNVFPIWSPALRDRLDDLPLLIDALLNKYVDSSKLVRVLRFDSDALGLLQNYSWPGNVRELENLIERLAINIPPSGLISAADLSFDREFNGLTDSDNPREFILSTRLNCLNNSAASVRHLLNRQELDSYLRELAQVGGDVTKAARRLGIRTLRLMLAGVWCCWLPDPTLQTSFFLKQSPCRLRPEKFAYATCVCGVQALARDRPSEETHPENPSISEVSR